jgi:hypothetical protein
MIKSSLKYLIPACINICLLTVLLCLWTDRLELIFNAGVRTWGFIEIVGFTMVSLIAIKILVSYILHKYIHSTSLKIKISVLLTFLISSFLYIDYSTKFISKVLPNRAFRNQIADKIKPSKLLAFGTKAEGLTIKEYQEIAKVYTFPVLPDEASNIHYAYGYDGFLPDYILELTYDLPVQIKVDTMHIKNRDFSRYQSFEIIDHIKRVTYTEYEQ